MCVFHEYVQLLLDSPVVSHGGAVVAVGKPGSLGIAVAGLVHAVGSVAVVGLVVHDEVGSVAVAGFVVHGEVGIVVAGLVHAVGSVAVVGLVVHDEVGIVVVVGPAVHGEVDAVAVGPVHGFAFAVLLLHHLATGILLEAVERVCFGTACKYQVGVDQRSALVIGKCDSSSSNLMRIVATLSTLEACDLVQ
jgi:hypothetical protein